MGEDDTLSSLTVWITAEKSFCTFYEHMLSSHPLFLVKLCLAFNLGILGRRLDAFNAVVTPIQTATRGSD